VSLNDRIRTERYVECMVALDTFDLITDRVRRLLSYGRRMSMTRRYTYIDSSPDLTAGLTVDTDARGGGIVEGSGHGGRHFGVHLRPGLEGFGFSAYDSDGNATEEEAWKRYHAGGDTGDHWSRRRNMTLIRLNGGLEGDFGPGRDDHIVILAWNEHAVCEERVIAFDLGVNR